MPSASTLKKTRKSSAYKRLREQGRTDSEALQTLAETESTEKTEKAEKAESKKGKKGKNKK